MAGAHNDILAPEHPQFFILCVLCALWGEFFAVDSYLEREYPKLPMKSLRPLLFFLALGLTLLFGVWGGVGPPRRLQEHLLPVMPTTPQIQPQVILGRLTIKLETPQYLRLGDAGLFRLWLLLEENSSAPGEPSLPGSSGLPADMFSLTKLTMIAEARLDLAGMEVRPDQEISEPLFPGKPLTFYWSVRATQAGEYHGVAWLHLRLITEGEETRLPLSAQEVRLQVRTLWGLSANTARWLSLFWGIMTFLLGLPYLKDIGLWLQRKLQRWETSLPINDET